MAETDIQKKTHYLSRKQANLLRIIATATLISAIAKFIPIQFLWRLKKNRFESVV